jgi:hypothetical protein
MAAGGAHGSDTALEIGNLACECRNGGVCEARVDVAHLGQSKEARCANKWQSRQDQENEEEGTARPVSRVGLDGKLSVEIELGRWGTRPAWLADILSACMHACSAYARILTAVGAVLEHK